MFVKIDITFQKSLDICTHLCKNNGSINNRRRTSDECGNRNKTVPSVAGKGQLFIDFIYSMKAISCLSFILPSPLRN